MNTKLSINKLCFLLIAGCLIGSISSVSAAGDYWTVKASMPTSRGCSKAATVNNKIYVIGGMYYDEVALNFFYINANEEYDPVTDSWAFRTPTPTSRCSFALTAVNNKIYAMGGSPFGISTNEEYDPSTNSWATKASMPTGRMNISAASVGNKIYTFGGSGWYAGSYTNINEEYDVITNSWAAKASMPTSRDLSSANAINGKIYVTGGVVPSGWFFPSGVFANEEYNPATNVWVSKAPTPGSYYLPSFGVVNNKIYSLTEASFSGSLDTIKEYDPINNIWTSLMSNKQIGAGAVASLMGKLYLMAGTSCMFCYTSINSNLEYTPPAPIAPTVNLFFSQLFKKARSVVTG